MNTVSAAAIPLEEVTLFAERPRSKVNEEKSRIKELYSNESILEGLKTQDTRIIQFIYKNFFQPVRFMVTSNSGTQMDAEDVFQDALMVIFKKIKEGNLFLTCAFNTYLYSVCKHIWLQKLNKHGIQIEYKDVMDHEPFDDLHEFDRLIEDNEKFRLYQEHFERLSADDQKMLKLFLKKIPLAEIAKIMGYGSYEYAKVRKYIVKEKLKTSIMNDPGYRRMVDAGEGALVFNI